MVMGLVQVLWAGRGEGRLFIGMAISCCALGMELRKPPIYEPIQIQSAKNGPQRAAPGKEPRTEAVKRVIANVVSDEKPEMERNYITRGACLLMSNRGTITVSPPRKHPGADSLLCLEQIEGLI